MENNARKFNQETYDKYDNLAKVLMKKHLTNKNYIICKEKEDYGVDLIAFKDGLTVNFELEVSSLNFTNIDDFKYPNVSFLSRKEKMIKKCGDFHYIIISSNLKYALTAKATEIFQSENKFQKYAGKGRDGIDEFFQLNKDKVKFFKL